MNLRAAIEQAVRLASEGSHDEAVARLTAAEPTADDDVETLRAFVELCHRWGLEEPEAMGLRSLIAREARVEDLLRLLDLLQPRLNTLKGAERVPVAAECVLLGTEALRLLGQGPVDETRADLFYSRGLRHLDLARECEPGHLECARSDILQYVSWLREDRTVPKHLLRGNLIAFAEVDLAEVLLLEGRQADAASLLEGAIGALEGAKIPGWMTKRAYNLLERAWA